MPSATYDTANRHLAFGDNSMTYDANGNLTSMLGPSGVTSFSWEARNRLISLIAPVTTANFTYDLLGRRLAKTIGGFTTQHLHDGLSLVQEVAESAQVTYLHSLRADEPLSRNASEFYLADGPGSVVALTDPTGSIGTNYTFEPFGRTTDQGASSLNPFQYTGRENDGTGLYYYRARYYSPILHRFLSQDAVTEVGANRYAYVRNTPLNATDPYGLRTFMIHGGPASSGPGGSSDAGGNRGLNRISSALQQNGEPVVVLNSGELARVVEEAKQAKLAGEPVFIVGHSLGGETGSAASLELLNAGFPVDHLILIDSFVPVAPQGIPTTNFYQQSGLPFGFPVENANPLDEQLIRGLGRDGHFRITEDRRVRRGVLDIILGRRK